MYQLRFLLAIKKHLRYYTKIKAVANSIVRYMYTLDPNTFAAFPNVWIFKVAFYVTCRANYVPFY